MKLVFSGGGVLGSAYVGVIKALEEVGILKMADAYAGSSIGGVVAALLACGADAKFIEASMVSLDLHKIRDASWFPIMNVSRVFNYFGWYRGDYLDFVVKDLIGKLTGDSEMTFDRLYERYGKVLVLTGTDLNAKKTVYFQHVTTPNMKIHEALRITASFPLFFTAVNRTEYPVGLFIDGGVLNNYPINVFSGAEDVLGFRILHDDVTNHPPQPVTNLVSYIEALVQMVYDQAQRAHVHTTDWVKTVKISVGDLSSMNLDLPKETIDMLVLTGYNATLAFVNQPV